MGVNSFVVEANLWVCVWGGGGANIRKEKKVCSRLTKYFVTTVFSVHVPFIFIIIDLKPRYSIVYMVYGWSDGHPFNLLLSKIDASTNIVFRTN